MRKQSGATVDWDERRERVKDAFILSWDGYEQYAWGTSSRLRRSSTGTEWRPFVHEIDRDPEELMN